MRRDAGDVAAAAGGREPKASATDPFDVVIQRVKDLKGLHLNFEVARVLNMAPHALQAWQAAGRVPLLHLAGFAADEGIDLAWLLSGERANKRGQAAPENPVDIREIRRNREPKPRRRSGEPVTAGREPLSLGATLQRIRDLKGADSEADVARLLGMTRQALRREGFALDHFTRFGEQEGVSLRWLLAGSVPGENRAERPQRNVARFQSPPTS